MQNADGKRYTSNMMQNGDGKRDPKNMMQNGEERADQKNMMQNREERANQKNMMQNERADKANLMQNGEERADNANMERRTVDCEEPWKAVSGFPDKCYLYPTSTMEYETSNALCTERHQWSRLFTPMSMQERESVELALIPDTVRNTTSGRYYTSFVGNASGTQQYSSNSFPFEMVNKDLWAKSEPNVGGPQCVLAFPQPPEKNDNRVGLCDVPCTTNQWSGNSVVCEVARMN